VNATLRIELFGGLCARQGDGSITRFSTQKTGALLAYLAYHRERPHPREVLIEQLWPNAIPGAGRQSLSQALSSLRRQFEPPGVAAGTCFIADRHAVGVNRRAIETDVAEFESRLTEAAQSSSVVEKVRALDAAVRLYRGELLVGYYEDWILTESQRLAGKLHEAARQLVEHYARAGDHDRALECALLTVGADPLCEESRLTVMRLCAVRGETAAALKQFDDFERLMREEFGEAPAAQVSPKLREFAGAHAAKSRAGPARARATTHSSAASVVTPTSRLSMPSGLVTFLVMEGDQEAQSLLRSQLRRYGGRIAHSGDELLAAFASPGSAVDCAIALQRATRDSAGKLAPCVALDTGEARLETGRYHGVVLDHLCGLLGAAHAGQILCSEATTAVLRRDLNHGIGFRDLGAFRLRDDWKPERLFQVNFPGAAAVGICDTAEFPAPRATPAVTSNLPITTTRFVGRGQEVARLRAMLSDAETRLISLTGTGGCGKTRLAIETAGELSDLVANFVPLTEISHASHIPDAVLDALRLARGEQPALEQLVAALAAQPTLLVLDNFEQLVARAEGPLLVQQLLARVPRLKCLVTSRVRLNLAAEREFVVSPLPVPGGARDPEQLTLCESVQLFIDRAQAVRPDFQVTRRNAVALSQLCDRLEGIPLALELAAARAQVLTPAQMLARMEQRFDWLATRRRDAPERHRTLRAAIDWSCKLLTQELREFFAQLSVFRGGWTEEAAKTVLEEPLALDHLASLRDHSLIQITDADGGEHLRFSMLETIREYADELLAADQRIRLRQQFVDYYTMRVENHSDPLPENDYLNRLDDELENLRFALDWSLQHDSSRALRLATALGWFWTIRGYWTEGRTVLDRALALASLTVSSRHWRAKALNRLGVLAFHQGEHDRACEWLSQGRQLHEDGSNQRGVAFSDFNLGRIDCALGEEQRARERIEAALAAARSLNDTSFTAACLDGLGSLARAQDDFAAAQLCFEQSLRLQQQLPSDRGTATALLHLGQLACAQDDWAVAHSRLLESLRLFRKIDDTSNIATTLALLGRAALRRGEQDSAHSCYLESLKLWQRLGGREGIIDVLLGLARVALIAGDREQAALLAGGVAACCESQADSSSKPPVSVIRELTDFQQTLNTPMHKAAWESGARRSLNDLVETALSPYTRA